MKKVVTVPEHKRTLFFCDKCNKQISYESLKDNEELCQECSSQTNFTHFMKNKVTAESKDSGNTDKQKKRASNKTCSN